MSLLSGVVVMTMIDFIIDVNITNVLNNTFYVKYAIWLTKRLRNISYNITLSRKYGTCAPQKRFYLKKKESDTLQFYICFLLKMFI